MNKESKNTLYAMFRRWAYMVVAIVAAGVLPMKPVFNFQEDKGIIYIRSFSMDKEMFYVTQTELSTGASEVVSTKSVAGLYYCARTMYYLCILCLLCFFSNKWRMWICVITAVCAGAYYILMLYYAVTITDNFYTTLYPTYMALLPAVVLQMMILVRQNVLLAEKQWNEDEEKE